MKKALLLIFILILSVSVILYLHANKNRYNDTIYSDLCVTWKKNYIIPYKYNGFFPPKHNYIRNVDSKNIGIAVAFITPKDLIIYIEKKNAYEINIEDYNYYIETDWSNIYKSDYQMCYRIDNEDGFTNPNIYERKDNRDTCYFIHFL